MSVRFFSVFSAVLLVGGTLLFLDRLYGRKMAATPARLASVVIIAFGAALFFA